MAVTAFASDPGTYEARLYKYGQYDANNPDSNLSMGDPAILNADVSYTSDVTTITVYVTDLIYEDEDENELTGHLTAMSILVDDEEIDGVPYTSTGAEITDTSVSPRYFVFSIDGNFSAGTQAFTAYFTINLSVMPGHLPGTLVLSFPAASS